MLFNESSEHKNYFQIIKSIQLIIKAFSLKYCNLREVMQNKALSASTNLSSASTDISSFGQASDVMPRYVEQKMHKRQIWKKYSELQIPIFLLFKFFSCWHEQSFFNLDSFNLHWKKKRDLFFFVLLFEWNLSSHVQIFANNLLMSFSTWKNLIYGFSV